MSARLRILYDAACYAGLDSAEGRTFEEWEARVSDYGLDDARQSLEIWQQQLEHSLATAFVKWTKERDPTERGILWLEMHETAKKLEQLNAD